MPRLQCIFYILEFLPFGSRAYFESRSKSLPPGLVNAIPYIGLGDTVGGLDFGISLLLTTADNTVLILHWTIRQASLCESNQIIDSAPYSYEIILQRL